MDISPEIVAALSSPKKIVITSHQKPDGDALGSSLALYGFLKKLHHNVSVIYPTDFPDYYIWMPFVQETSIFNVKKHHQLIVESDIIFYLDFNSIDRIEEMKASCLQSPAIKIMIDHHLNPDNIATHAFSNSKYSSTSEMIHDFISGIGHRDMIDKDIATCLYTGIVTDTGGFQFSSTGPNTHLVASYLLTKQIDTETIYNNCYNNFSLDRLRLFGYCLLENLVLVNKHVAYLSITEKEKIKFNIREGDTEGLVNYPLKIGKIEIVALFKQDQNKIKISFRSKGNHDVNELARKYFNGGGHRNAAGGTSFDSMEETKKRFENCFKTN